ncbi:hypothetical protein [Psychroflexus aestuariivivens]|uniref:hypothetical protein n=1 Tax=Psychroflexus aestuariivivens TaxID=1795040 RepID=UPI000FD6FDF2|nr:hypothetical protein [Psychroflexus aestuariivivens]
MSFLETMHNYALNFIQKLFFSGLLIFTILACKSDSSENYNQENTGQSEQSKNLEETLQTDTISVTSLSKASEEVTREWMSYIALNSEIERMDNYSLQDLVNNSETILKVTDSLQQTVPKKINTNALQARIRTLYTHARLLEENAKRNKPNPDQLKELGTKLKLDFNNFNIQINEVFIQQEDSIQTRNRL